MNLPGGGDAVAVGREGRSPCTREIAEITLLSHPLRHAGMCPAAAAELEYEYRPGQVLVVSVALYCFIRFRGSYILIQCTMILSTYDC